MTPPDDRLGDRLIRRIRLDGPMRVDQFMAECLLNPAHGYYAGRGGADPLGAAGDFTTAPEISQMFGELVGLALAQAWLDQGAPAPFTLAELGPGRGTLMADILRATRAVPGFGDAAQVVLVEASPALRARQKAALGDTPRWITQAADLPRAPLFLVANEFFDALPIRQFLREGRAWRERLVGLDGDRLAFGLSAPMPVAALAPRLDDTRDGDMVELCPAADAILQEVAGRIAAHGGAALVVDYGARRSLGDSLQAVRGHEKVGVLDSPGQADLSAHVDFSALMHAARPLAAALTTQGRFLERLGIAARAEALAASLTGEARATHLAAHRRLTHPDEMGSLFKVLGLVPPGAPMLAGVVDDAA